MRPHIFGFHRDRQFRSVFLQQSVEEQTLTAGGGGASAGGPTATGYDGLDGSEVVGGASGYPQSVGDHTRPLGGSKGAGAYPELDFLVVAIKSGAGSGQRNRNAGLRRDDRQRRRPDSYQLQPGLGGGNPSVSARLVRPKVSGVSVSPNQVEDPASAGTGGCVYPLGCVIIIAGLGEYLVVITARWDKAGGEGGMNLRRSYRVVGEFGGADRPGGYLR